MALWSSRIALGTIALCRIHGDVGASAADCLNLRPAATSQHNYGNIKDCLEDGGLVVLIAGEDFPVPWGITLPPQSSLKGGSGGFARLRLSARTARTSFLLRTGTNSSLSRVILDGGDNLAPSRYTSILRVEGDGSIIDDVEVTNTTVGVGVHFTDSTLEGRPASNNILSKVIVSFCYYGVVFARGLGAEHRNRFANGRIENIACDAVALPGYGEVFNNIVGRSGDSCWYSGLVIDGSEGGTDGAVTHRGAGIYAVGNFAGAIVVGNIVTDICGMALDLDSCANFNISFNELANPGYTADGLAQRCAGAVAVTLLDSQHCHVESNVIANHHILNMLDQHPDVQNARLDRRELEATQSRGMAFQDVTDDHVVRCLDRIGTAATAVFQDTRPGTPAFSDLPDRGRTVVAFAMLQRPRVGSFPSGENTIIRNSFAASCGGSHAGQPDDGANSAAGRATDGRRCAALAYFVGRGTGLFRGVTTRPMRNRFDENTVPTIALARQQNKTSSRRCGSNSYTQNSLACAPGGGLLSPLPCNQDDFEHSLDVFRNDLGCADFIALVGAQPQNGPGEVADGLRVPLPTEPVTNVGMWHFSRKAGAGATKSAAAARAPPLRVHASMESSRRL
eukprot:TRINITY_DN37150_c0_g3_i1.p1 TRINITY_DN37150_c0_g3~~TRINITY_DN37150_c0_g3_i1.p1  ORF type:complete len:621 (+),score=95.96 TRINITY_DN37150_c0_g3_i1:179-2041(+)